MQLLNMKMENYSDKVFENHFEKPDSDSEGDDVPIPKEMQVVKISRLSRVM